MEGGRLVLRNGTSGLWLQSVRETDRSNGSVQRLLETYRGLLEALLAGAGDLQGTLQARFEDTRQVVRSLFPKWKLGHT